MPSRRWEDDADGGWHSDDDLLDAVVSTLESS
jgi:hypothetical protein